MSIQRLKNYASTASTPSAAGCSLVTGVVIAAIPGSATAGLQIWNVGQILPQIGSGSPASQDLQLQATFDTAFQINLFNSTSTYVDQVFWAPNDNLSFINVDFNYGPGRFAASWMNTVLIGADALNGVDSNGGYSKHDWYGATNSHTPVVVNEINGGLARGETSAFGIRFVASGDYYYGWVEVSMDNNWEVSVERWALETTANTAAEYSPAGSTAVPGLGGLAALAIGAAGVRSRRQRTVA